MRTVSIRSRTIALAACQPTERLVGGGCDASEVHASYPSGYGSEDTVGARWNCTVSAGVYVTAYALCMKL